MNVVHKLLFISGNYEKYTAVGQQILLWLLNVIRIGLNSMSIDEAYLDVTGK